MQSRSEQRWQRWGWEGHPRAFSASPELFPKGLGLAVDQGVQPLLLERLVEFCGKDRLCPGVAAKVFEPGPSLPSLFLLSPPPCLQVEVGVEGSETSVSGVPSRGGFGAATPALPVGCSSEGEEQARWGEGEASLEEPGAGLMPEIRLGGGGSRVEQPWELRDLTWAQLGSSDLCSGPGERGSRSWSWSGGWGRGLEGQLQPVPPGCARKASPGQPSRTG